METENTQPQKIDYSQFREESLDTFYDLDEWVQDDLLVNNIRRIINACVKLPSPEIQLPLISTYCLLPSALCRILPVLFCYGKSGSGKSTLGFLASKIHDVNILSSGDTFASIRNNLSDQKGKFSSGENNIMMIWDDIDELVLVNKPDIYRMLKYGYDRSSDTISIASKGGTNMSFRVFSPKVISTISPIYNSPNFPELVRRCMVIKTEKILGDDDEILDPKLINWKGLKDEFLNIWTNIENCKEFTHIRKSLTRRKPKLLSSERWLISMDILTTGVILGTWDDIKSSIDWLKSYWEFYDNLSSASQSSLEELIQDFLFNETSKQRQLNELLEVKQPIIVDAERFKRKVQEWQHKGLLDIEPKLPIINNIMSSYGYKLTKKGWLKNE